jgi:hypothetical protein
MSDFYFFLPLAFPDFADDFALAALTGFDVGFETLAFLATTVCFLASFLARSFSFC